MILIGMILNSIAIVAADIREHVEKIPPNVLHTEHYFWFNLSFYEVFSLIQQL